MSQDHHSQSNTVEGIARVVRLDGEMVWLEPEQTASCGSCAGAAACGTAGQEPGIGTVTNRIQARRFTLDNPHGPMELSVGDRVIIAVSSRSLIKASLVAFAVPMFFAIVGGSVGQDLFADDATTMVCMVAGLAIGLLAARFGANYLSSRGDLTPQLIRRARPGETCNS